MTKPKIKKLPVIECWATKMAWDWEVTSSRIDAAIWAIDGNKVIPGTFIPHKEGKH